MSTQQHSGIYAIVNRINGKRYVGSSSELKARLRAHKGRLKSNYHPNPHLQAAWNKYGSEAFDFIVLEYVHPEFLLDIEQKYIDKNKRGYNLSKWADAPTRGTHRTPETKAKLRAAHIGKKHSLETRAKISASGKNRWTIEAIEKARMRMIGNTNTLGFKHTQESRAKMSSIWKGRTLTPEHIEKLRAAGLGRKHTPETLLKMSMAKKGYVASAETRAKLSKAGKGKKHTPESRAKISAGNMGRIHSLETRAKISASRIGHVPTAETRAKISAAGKSRTPESYAKMVATRKARIRKDCH